MTSRRERREKERRKRLRHGNRMTTDLNPRWSRPTGRTLVFEFCKPCKKRSWATEKIARTVASKAHRNTDLHVYECPHRYGRWHYGHPTGGHGDQ